MYITMKMQQVKTNHLHTNLQQSKEYREGVGRENGCIEQKITKGSEKTAASLEHSCKEVNKFSSFAAAKALLVIISLMIVDCSAMPLPPASCSAGICAVGEPTSVTCLFGRNILTSSHGVSVQSFPFNSTKKDPGKDALVCSWQNNVQDCFVEDGYSFNSIISDRLTLQIPVATREIAGVYKCHVASEDSPPRSCILTVTERQESTPFPTKTNGTTGKATSTTAEASKTMGLERHESTPFPTKTNGTTGKATSTTAEASKTMGLGYSVIVISLGVFAVVAASALIHLLFYKRLKSRFKLAEKNTSGQNMGGTEDETQDILPKNRQTCRIEQQIEEENRSLEQTP